jgi:hypothetical protein
MSTNHSILSCIHGNMDKVRGLGFRAKTQNPKQLKSVELNLTSMYQIIHDTMFFTKWSSKEM